MSPSFMGDSLRLTIGLSLPAGAEAAQLKFYKNGEPYIFPAADAEASAYNWVFQSYLLPLPATEQNWAVSMLAGGEESVYSLYLPASAKLPIQIDLPAEQAIINAVTPATSVSISGTKPTTHLLRFAYNFPVAVPPMSAPPQSLANLVPVEKEAFLLPANLKLEIPGLYYFQPDTTQLAGLPLLQVAEGFPKLKSFEQLVEPLVYITTAEEQQQQERTDDKRKWFEQFWLQSAGSEAGAQAVIKTYYQRVTLSNWLFTSFKEGWKTDRGIIFVIFGPPDKVYTQAQQEQWVYKNTAGNEPLSFTFTVSQSALAPYSLQLQRDAAYKGVWYEQVKRWRNGLIVK